MTFGGEGRLSSRRPGGGNQRITIKHTTKKTCHQWQTDGQISSAHRTPLADHGQHVTTRLPNSWSPNVTFRRTRSLIYVVMLSFLKMIIVENQSQSPDRQISIIQLSNIFSNTGFINRTQISRLH